MDTPIPTPRKNAPLEMPLLNKGYVSSDLSSPGQEEMPSFLHVAEVHSSKTQLLGSSDELSGKKKVEKKRKKVRKRSTFTLKKSEDEIRVYNSDEIDDFNSSKDTVTSAESQKSVIKLRGSSAVSVKERVDRLNMMSQEGFVGKSASDPQFKLPRPMSHRRPKGTEKRGSATETLTDSSTDEKVKIVPLSASGHRKPRGSATETLSEDSDVCVKPPIPLPRKSITKSTENVEVKNTESPKSYCTSSSMDYKDTGVIPPPRQKRHKKKRKLKDAPSPPNSDLDIEKAEERIKKTPTPTLDSDDTAVCLTIHGAEPLKMKDFNSRPFLRVHVLDVKTSSYRRSAFGKMNVDILQTHPFDCVFQRTVVPRWNEDLLWMEPISHIASLDTLLIFELLSESEEIITWAFLRPIAVNGATNVGKRLRLQFYKPSRLPSAAKDSNLPKAFFWWQQDKHSNYKSTLFVTLNAVPSDFIVKPQKEPEEKGEDEKPMEERAPEESGHVEEELHSVVWSRLPTLSCKLPNAVMTQLPAGPDGGMAIAYSHSGLLLASHTSHTITIFTYKGSRYLTLVGHQGLVYSLSWSSDDNCLLSSSADATACVWDVANKRTRPVKVFPHPSYVYSACWLELNLVATGCYDYQVRLWSTASDLGAHPVQHLLHHKARVNTLVALKPDGNEILVSGDSDGVIIFWKAKSEGSIELSRELKIRELKGKIINLLTVHPAGKRLLVHTRDSLLRMIDIASGSVIQWFQGGINTKFQTSSTFCGCGSRVLACSEDGSLSVWDGHTGEKVAIYTKFYLPDAPAAMSFHPHDHMLAVVSYSHQGFPALTIGTFERDSEGEEIGLIWTEKELKSNSVSSSSRTTSKGSLNEEASPKTKTGKVKKKKKEIGIFKSLLLGGKKEKKGIPNDAFTDSEFLPTKQEYTAQRVKRELKIDIGSDTQMDNRLTDIIKKMDKILVSVSPKP